MYWMEHTPATHNRRPQAERFRLVQARFGHLAGAMFTRALGESGTNAGTQRLPGSVAWIATGIALLALSLGLAACGGGQRQDVTEPSGNFPVQVVTSKFPTHQ